VLHEVWRPCFVPVLQLRRHGREVALLLECSVWWAQMHQRAVGHFFSPSLYRVPVGRAKGRGLPLVVCLVEGIFFSVVAECRADMLCGVIGMSFG